MAQSHIRKRDAAREVTQEFKDARPLVQQRITTEELVGQTYTDDKIDSILLWLKIIAKLNISAETMDADRVSKICFAFAFGTTSYN